VLDASQMQRTHLCYSLISGDYCFTPLRSPLCAAAHFLRAEAVSTIMQVIMDGTEGLIPDYRSRSINIHPTQRARLTGSLSVPARASAIHIRFHLELHAIASADPETNHQVRPSAIQPGAWGGAWIAIDVQSYPEY